MLIDESVQGLLGHTKSIGILGIDHKCNCITILFYQTPSFSGVAFPWTIIDQRSLDSRGDISYLEPSSGEYLFGFVSQRTKDRCFPTICESDHEDC